MACQSDRDSMTYQERPWIALVGDAGAGKDTVAEVLTASYGYTRIAFADPVRQALRALNPLIPTPTGGLPWRLTDLVSAVGWETAKRDYPEVRALLQRLGTDAIRTLDPDFWVGTALRMAWVGGGPPVFTDTRFPNEIAMVRANGGSVIRVNRPGHTNPAAGHVSEEAWRTAEPDYTIVNDGTIDDLRAQVRRLMDMHVLEDAND